MAEQVKLTPEQRFDAAVTEVGRLSRQLRWIRRLAIALAVSLALDLGITAWLGGLTVVVVRSVDHNQAVQDCRDTRSQTFFAAERAKVQGQVAGLLELRNANGDQAKAVEGFDRFIHASQHYLHVIGEVRSTCA